MQDITITITQGASYELLITYTSTEWGNDLSEDFEARMQVRHDYADLSPGEPLLDLTSDEDGGIILGDGVANIRVELSADSTAALDRSDFPGRYDLELEHVPTGKVQRIRQGRAVLDREVTI